MSERTMGRRTFVIRGSLAVAGLAAAPGALAGMHGGGGGGGGGGMGTTIVDPPVSGPLLELPVARGEAKQDPMLGACTQYTLEAREASVTIAGASARAMVYDDPLSVASGRFVAPLIRASPGERVRLRFVNGLPDSGATNLLGHPKYPTNIHVHGLHVSPGSDARSCLPADDVHRSVAPGGGELWFDYDLGHQRPGSLALYHPHLHGTVAEQMWSGLVGAIDVSDGGITSLAPYPATVLLLKDVTIASGAPAPYTSLSEYMRGKEGDLVTINGQVNPYLAAAPEQVRRLRIANVSNARFYRLALQGHLLHMVGTDGGLLDRPSVPQSELLMAPGERVDVLVKVSGTRGDYKLLALPYARHGNMASAQRTLLTLRVSGTRAPQALPGTIDPAARRIGDDPALRRKQFTLGMAHGRGYIDGISFEVLADGSIRAAEHHSMVGTEEIWEVVNQSGMDHPWHQHVNDGQVLAISGGDAAVERYAALYTTVPGWKDTVIVPKWGSATFRIPVKHFGGMTMFHCHILEHEDIGMMGMWHLMPMDAGGCAMPMGM
jgi:FtsP/CotA-like multicopper oxidase with cupredoxin domain